MCLGGGLSGSPQVGHAAGGVHKEMARWHGMGPGTSGTHLK